MGRAAGATSRIFIDEFDFSGVTNQAEMPIDIDTPEVTAFSDLAKEFVEGKYGCSPVINGFFDPADDGYDEQMWAILVDGIDNYLGIYPGNDASHGDIGYEHIAAVKGQARPIEVAGALLLHVSFEDSQPIVRSTVLVNGAVTATGAVTNSNKNWGATAAGESFVAILRVLSVTGAGSITVEIEESTDDGSGDAYAQLIAFTAKTAIGVERKAVVTATEAYKRVNVTAYATFTSVTILVVIGKEQGVS